MPVEEELGVGALDKERVLAKVIFKRKRGWRVVENRGRVGGRERKETS